MSDSILKMTARKVKARIEADHRRELARLILWWHELNCFLPYRAGLACTCISVANNVAVGELNPSLYKITKPPTDWIPSE